MSRLMAWIKASRMPSQSYVLFPLLFGQALAVAQGAHLTMGAFVLVHLFGLFVQLYIVYANDYADAETDTTNVTYTLFSGGSRVIPDGDLEPRQLRNAAVVMVGLSLVCGLLLGLLYGRWLELPLIAGGLTLLWMYSFGPARLSYRGGGELLQAVGVGLVLPLVGYHAQAPALSGFPWLIMAAFLPTQLACAMATALPDEPSDRESGKRTLPVLIGPGPTKLVIILLNGLGLVALPLVSWPGTGSLWWVMGVPLAATTGMGLFVRARPGSLALSAFVGLALLATVGLTAAMAFTLLLG